MGQKICHIESTLKSKIIFVKLVLTGPIHPEKVIEVSMGMSGLLCCEVCCKRGIL